MFQLSTEGLETWSVEVVFSILAASCDEPEEVDSDEDETSEVDDCDEILQHVAEFNVTTDGGSVVDIARHIQENPRMYFDALDTGIDYLEIQSVTVTNMNLSTEPTFLLIQGKNMQ